MKSSSGTLWALVTDSGMGRVVELQRSPPAMRQVSERESPSRHLAGRELTTDASGRDFHTGGPVSHARQPRSDPREAVERAFVRDWVRRLEKAHAGGRFDHLMLVADPRTLGRLREQLSAAVRASVIREEASDLVNLAPRELESRLRLLAGWSG